MSAREHCGRQGCFCAQAVISTAFSRRLLEPTPRCSGHRYRVSAFHKEPSAIKTDAPNQVPPLLVLHAQRPTRWLLSLTGACAQVVWDIMRCWVAKHPLSSKRVEAEKSPGALILEKVSQAFPPLPSTSSPPVAFVAREIVLGSKRGAVVH